MKKIIFFGITGLILFSFNSCFKDDVIIDTDKISEFDRPLNLAGPVVVLEKSATDLFDKLSEGLKDYIHVDDEGLLYVQYTDSVNVYWDDIVKMEETNQQQNYPIYIPPGQSDLSGSITFVEKIKLNEHSDQQFDSMIVETGNLNLYVDFPSQLSGEVLVSFPEVSLDGQILEIQFNSSDNTSSAYRSLDGYHVEFLQGVDSSYITMQITAQNISSQNASGGTYNIGVSLTIDNIVPEIIFGSFGSSTVVDQDESMSFSMFNDLKVFDMIQFYDIQLDMNFESHYGVSYDATIDDILISSSEKEDTVEIILMGGNSFLVEAATYNGTIVPSLNNEHFDNTNSNIQDAVSIMPDKMNYHVRVITNPDDANALNFVTGQNRISSQYNILVPLYLRCEAYSRIDTLNDIDFNDMIDDDNLEYLDSVVMSFEVENWFPFDLDIQGYFIDDMDNIVDSVFFNSGKFLVSGVLDDNDIISEAGITEELDVILSKSKIEKLKDNNVTKILLHTKTVTADNGTRYVKILEDYGFKLKLGIEIVSDEL